MLPLAIDWYVTVLDLGGWGALYTTGWDREVYSTGAAAKATKQTINHKRIYPPRDSNRAELFAAAAPTVQAPPDTRARRRQRRPGSVHRSAQRPAHGAARAGAMTSLS